MDEDCACGHVLDEHVESLRVGGNRIGACTIDGCACVYFEAVEDQDDDGLD